MTRRELRVLSMQILFTYDFNQISIEKAKEEVLEDKMEYEDLKSINHILNVYVENEDKINNLIIDSLLNYTIDRLNLTDKAIIRLASAEMIDGLAKNVAINEALEITKIYSDGGDNKAVKFNNRLLDTISKKI